MLLLGAGRRGGGGGGGATSYANTGGTGDRSAVITVTSDLSVNGGVSMLVNGLFTTQHYWNGGQSNKYIKFDFGVGAAKRIDEFKFYQDSATSQGTWVMEGSNDDSSYTTFPESFSLGSGGSTHTQTLTNTNTYRYYRLSQTGGTTNVGPWVYEIEFKIA